METTLIIMAAGNSSRYGSLKQTEILGPSAVTLMEYSIYDAIKKELVVRVDEKYKKEIIK